MEVRAKTTGAGGQYQEVEIVNSPVLSPAHYAFYALDRYCADPTLNDVPAELLSRFGAIDVFHFQNIEGLTAGFLKAVRAAFPASKIIFSAHNYNLVCPQVNLWFREHANCVDYHEGRACINCLENTRSDPYEHENRAVMDFLSRLPIRRSSGLGKLVEWAVRTPIRLRRPPRGFNSMLAPDEHSGKVVRVTTDAKALIYKTFRETNIRLSESLFDRVLAVSKRTKEVLVDRGVPADQIDVSYIGTAHYEKSLAASRRTDFGERLHILYLGYMRSDKGFFFFMECLHRIPERISKQLDVTIAAPYGNNWPVEQLQSLGHKFGNLTLHNGYTHDTLQSILAPAHLGIVPVLWEDNLPQVAIELVAHGIPILTSNRGGAHEIADHPGFTFQAGSRIDFISALTALVERRTLLSDFWRAPLRLVSMEQHVAELLPLYGDQPRDGQP